MKWNIYKKIANDGGSTQIDEWINFQVRITSGGKFNLAFSQSKNRFAQGTEFERLKKCQFFKDVADFIRKDVYGNHMQFTVGQF